MFFPMQLDYLLGVGQRAVTKSVLMTLLRCHRVYKKNEKCNWGEEFTRSGFLQVLTPRDSIPPPTRVQVNKGISPMTFLSWLCNGITTFTPLSPSMKTVTPLPLSGFLFRKHLVRLRDPLFRHIWWSLFKGYVWVGRMQGAIWHAQSFPLEMR